MINLEEQEKLLKEFESRMGLQFTDRRLFFRCFVHDSYVYENEGITGSNERLEFLGDSVLGLVISHLLFARYPHWEEGKLALLKSRLVSSSSLAEVARKIQLGSFIFLGHGEETRGGRDKGSILADALEALIGAIYIDMGFQCAYDFVSGLFEDSLDNHSPLKDSKSFLQEYSQKVFKALPQYRVIHEAGPPHDKTFHVCVRLEDQIQGVGEGSSKKEAEQSAAGDLLNKLGIEDEAIADSRDMDMHPMENRERLSDELLDSGRE